MRLRKSPTPCTLLIDDLSAALKPASYIQDNEFWRYTPTKRNTARSDSARYVEILSSLLYESVAPAERRFGHIYDGSDTRKTNLAAMSVSGKH